MQDASFRRHDGGSMMRWLQRLSCFLAILCSATASAGTRYEAWHTTIDHTFSIEDACLRLLAVRVDKDESELTAVDMRPYDVAARITTCDGRFIAQLREGKLPME